MKNTFIVFLAVFFTALSLNACVKDQNTGGNGNTVAADPSTANDTNYQNMMDEQADRAAQAEAANRAAATDASYEASHCDERLDFSSRFSAGRLHQRPTSG